MIANKILFEPMKLISNYDTPAYNELLEGWTKTTIETVTGVGSKKNNKRTECLWYNY